MSDFALTCCSTADMPPDFFTERDIPYVCFHYTIEGEEYPDDLGKSISFPDFYAKIAAGAMPTTSQVNVGQFVNFFEPLLKEEKDILHISLSSGISGSYNSAGIARDELINKYPKRKILIVDSLGASSGYGLLVASAADLRDSGMSLEDVYHWVEEHKLNLHHWFFSSDLSHYKRGGRISSTSALLGTMLNLCPLMDVSCEGKLMPRTKLRGKNQAIREIVKRMEKFANDGLDYSGLCFISHSACYDDARQTADLIEQKFPRLSQPVKINSVGAVIGAHTGPGTVALFFFGDRRID